MTAVRQTLGFGAELVAPGRTRFRLWAPGCEQVSLEIEGAAPMAMRAQPDGWFEIEADCGAGAEYLYRVREDIAAPDPASRSQAGGVHGRSVVVDPAAYDWRCGAWTGRPWSEAVIYELHAGLLGGFAGVADQLPALKALGVTAIEIMPVAEFPGVRGWGYDGVLPYAPHAAYGGPEALKALVDAAHSHGLCVILDVVYNHFGPDGNYLPVYAPSFFREDRKTPWGSAIDFRRDQVRRFFSENALYWINEYRFDGLRFDAVHAINNPTFIDEMAAEIRASVEPERNVWLILENERNQAAHLAGGLDAQWNDDVHHCLHVLLTGESDVYYEDFAESAAEQLAKALREGFVYQGEPSRHAGGAPRGEPSGELAPTAFVDCLQNHDQIGNRALGERLSALAEPAALRAAISLLLLSPHIPMIFMGEEVGTLSPFLYFTDHGPELAEAVRDGRRLEFAGFPHFADPVRRGQIPDPNAEATFEVSRPLPGPDADECRALYRDLLTLRRDRITPRLAGATAIAAVAFGPAAVAARWRLGDGATLTLAVNLAHADAELPWPLGEPNLWITGRGPIGHALTGASLAAWLDTP
jgi:maltooligosyltrehalose trehalohydrolase